MHLTKLKTTFTKTTAANTIVVGCFACLFIVLFVYLKLLKNPKRCVTLHQQNAHLL